MPDFERPQDPAVIVIQIDYAPSTPNPGRIFRSMAGLVEAFHRLDRDLARAVGVEIDPELVLERVSAGSIRGFFRTVLRQVDDDALHNLDWKPLVGQYLVKAKHAVLRWLDGRERIESRIEVTELQQTLEALAPPQLEGTLLPPAKVPVERLLEDIQAISESVEELLQADSAALVSVYDETPVEKRFHITDAEIALLLTQETVTGETVLVLPVKKPDYLGNSMWEFRHGDHIVEAKVLDEEWLERFQNGEIPLKPGDALRALVRAEIARGFEGNVVAARYSLLKVLGVVRNRGGEQQNLLT